MGLFVLSVSMWHVKYWYMIGQRVVVNYVHSC